MKNKLPVRLIVNLDDIGCHKDITDASIEVMERGIAKSGSIMVPAPDFTRTVQIIKDKPELHFGIHITLTNEWQEKLPWKPLMSKEEVPSLYNEAGLMWRDEELLAQYAKAEDVEKEMEKQISVAFENKIKLSHMDTHMFCFYKRDDLFKTALKLAEKYNLPIPVPVPDFPVSTLHGLRSEGFRVPDTITGFYSIDGEESNPLLRLESYKNYIKTLYPGVHHIYIHAGRSTMETREIMPDISIRTADYDIWTSDEMYSYAKSNNISFISYADFK